MTNMMRFRLFTGLVVLPLIILAELATPAVAAPPPPTSLPDIVSFLSDSFTQPYYVYSDPVDQLNYTATGEGISWQVSTDGKVGRARITYAPWGLDYLCGICTENITPYYFEKSGKGWYLIQSADGVGGLGGQGTPQQILGLPSLLNVSGVVARDIAHGTFGPATQIYSPTRPPVSAATLATCSASLTAWLSWGQTSGFATQYSKSVSAATPLVAKVGKVLLGYLYLPTENGMPAWIAAHAAATVRARATSDYCTYITLEQSLRKGPSPLRIPAPPAG
jgi:hypothetical protein